MPKIKIPEFKTEEEEAEFWETHSPFDYNLKPEKVKVRILKDRPITIRLNGRTRQNIERVAKARGMTISSLIRYFISKAIQPKK